MPKPKLDDVETLPAISPLEQLSKPQKPKAETAANARERGLKPRREEAAANEDSTRANARAPKKTVRLAAFVTEEVELAMRDVLHAEIRLTGNRNLKMADVLVPILRKDARVKERLKQG